jgi:ankyrin repeat protein
MQLLLDKGAGIYAEDGRLLLMAAESGQQKVLRLLLEKGADVNAIDEWCNTPLTWAASRGDEMMVQLLLEKGADIEAKSYDGTALHAAAHEGHAAVVGLLLEKGADINEKMRKVGQRCMRRLPRDMRRW